MFWAGGSQAIRIGVQLVFLASLARFLRPDDFGVMAVASAVVAFAVLIRDLGTSAAIIQQQELQESTVSGAFWLNLAMGVLCAALLAGVSPWVAQVFRSRTLIPILCLLSITFLLTSATVVHQAILERRSQFRRLAFIEISSSISGLLLALFSAYQGAGVYALVVQALAQSLLSSLLLWKLGEWAPSVRPDLSSIRKIFHFSRNLTLFNFVNYISRNSDNMIIGRQLGTHSLGIYSVAYQIMLFPVQSFTGVINRALYPILCRKQGNSEESAALILQTLRNISLLTAPLMAMLWVLRKPFIHLVFGSRWADAESLVAWLAPVGFMQSLYGVTGIVFMARARTDRLLLLGFIGALLNFSAFLAGAKYGIHGVAVCYFIVNILISMMCFGAISMELGISIRRQARMMGSSVLGALIMALALVPLSGLLVKAPLISHLGLGSLAGCIIYGCFMILFFPSSWKMMLQEFEQLVASRSGGPTA